MTLRNVFAAIGIVVISLPFLVVLLTGAYQLVSGERVERLTPRGSWTRSRLAVFSVGYLMEGFGWLLWMVLLVTSKPTWGWAAPWAIMGAGFVLVMVLARRAAPRSTR